MPSSIKSFAERPRSIPSFLISLIKDSSSVVVNFFLSIPNNAYLQLKIYGKAAIYVPPYDRMFPNIIYTYTR